MASKIMCNDGMPPAHDHDTDATFRTENEDAEPCPEARKKHNKSSQKRQDYSYTAETPRNVESPKGVIPPGKTVALIVGETGAGKSSLINAMCSYFRGGTLKAPKIAIPTAYHKVTVIIIIIICREKNSVMFGLFICYPTNFIQPHRKMIFYTCLPKRISRTVNKPKRKRLHPIVLKMKRVIHFHL